jgi:hypothetical protein
MKALIAVLIISMLSEGIVAAYAEGVINLSTLGNRTAIEPIVLPQALPNMPTVPPIILGQNVNMTVLDLSILGKMSKPAVPPTVISGPAPITFTLPFAIRSSNITGAGRVYTPPIEIFGGA